MNEHCLIFQILQCDVLEQQVERLSEPPVVDTFLTTSVQSEALVAEVTRTEDRVTPVCSPECLQTVNGPLVQREEQFESDSNSSRMIIVENVNDSPTEKTSESVVKHKKQYNRRCIVKSCRNDEGPLHRFPADFERCTQWRKNMGLTHKSASELCNCICGRHFAADQYTYAGGHRLLWNAVPTIHEPVPRRNSKHLRRCADRNCRNPTGTFHSFPVDPVRSAVWAENLGCENVQSKSAKQLARSTMLCSRHFESDQFNLKNSTKRLVWNAVPTIFFGTDGRPYVSGKTMSSKVKREGGERWENGEEDGLKTLRIEDVQHLTGESMEAYVKEENMDGLEESCRPTTQTIGPSLSPRNITNSLGTIYFGNLRKLASATRNLSNGARPRNKAALFRKAIVLKWVARQKRMDENRLLQELKDKLDGIKSKDEACREERKKLQQEADQLELDLERREARLGESREKVMIKMKRGIEKGETDLPQNPYSYRNSAGAVVHVPACHVCDNRRESFATNSKTVIRNNENAIYNNNMFLIWIPDSTFHCSQVS